MSEQVNLTIDGRPVTVPKGTNVIEAAKQLGIEISAFCYHPGLEIVAVCRQCLVTVEGQPKLTPSCQAVATEGMVVKTADPQSTLARKQMLEFTLVNHPIDCPICDKAGECSLQRFYFDHDNALSRVDTPKVHKPKVVDLGPHIVLDAERCILCTRCIRVCDEVAGQHQLEMKNRNDHEELTTAPGQRLDNPYSLNTVDVCPVGALTSKDFRFTMRAWELFSTPSVCNGCATGCNIEVHHKDNRVWRLIPRYNPEVNKHWMCDEGRLTYHQLREKRMVTPLVGSMPSNWDNALSTAGKLLKDALAADKSKVAVVFSPQESNEANYVLARLVRDIWQLTRIFIGGKAPVPARADKILRDADVNPNTAGVKAILGETKASDTLALAELIKSGQVTTVLVLGHDTGIDNWGAATVITLATAELGPALASKVVLPIAAWTELDGTITNRQNKVQRLRAAYPTNGQALPAWQALCELAQACDAAIAYESPDQVFAEMSQKVSAFSGAEWGRRERTIQLRFANSRG